MTAKVAARAVVVRHSAGRAEVDVNNLIVKLRMMVHDDNLFELGDVDYAITALGISLPELAPCERLQRLAEALKLPHNPDGYTLAGIEKAVQEKVNWP